MASQILVFLSLLLISLPAVLAQQPRPNGVDGGQTVLAVEPDSPQSTQRNRTACDPEFRSVTGVCTNSLRKLLGSTGRAHAALQILASSANPTGTDRPGARFISNMLCKQSGDAFNDRGLNELATFFGQFIDHDFVATPGDSEGLDIPVPTDDPVFANFSGKLEFTRSSRVPVEFFGITLGVERPSNSLTSALDLSTVYGVNDRRANALRTSGGKLLTSDGNLLPLNKDNFSNAPNLSDKFFFAGETRANEHPMLTCLHTLFMREHNNICDELAAAFPDYDDERLYQTARKINGAQFQKIVYKEFYPALVGSEVSSPYRGFRFLSDVTIIDVFSTAAFRIGHTMVGNVVSRRGPGGTVLPSLPMKDTFFVGKDVLADGIEQFFRGAAATEAQEIDIMVHETLRNFLFTGIPEEPGFDLIALNIQRGRDHALPSYNEIRRLVGLSSLSSFAGITSQVSLQSDLMSVYGTVDKVDPWIGLVAEDHIPGGSMGPTMKAIWEKQFRNLRDGDVYYYENDIFSAELRAAIPRIDEMFTNSETLRAIILRNTDIADSELPSRIFFK